jgi:hypothetical protein
MRFLSLAVEKKTEGRRTYQCATVVGGVVVGGQAERSLSLSLRIGILKEKGHFNFWVNYFNTS